MTDEETEEFATALRRSRHARLAEMTDTDRDLRAMAEEREPEFEEAAQEDRTARLLMRLDDRGRQAVDGINAALDRIADGTYGQCLDCGEPIPVARLRVMPAAPRCVECAEKAEGRPPTPSLPDRTHHDPSAPDMAQLGDGEIAAAVRDALARDGGIDLQELRVRVRHGVVQLSGALPGESELDRVRKIVTDVVGVPDLEDRVQIEALAWERGDRTPDGGVDAEPAASPGAAPEADDVVRSVEEGVGWNAPDAPPPDEQER